MHQQKHQNEVWNLFRVNNNTRMALTDVSLLSLMVMLDRF